MALAVWRISSILVSESGPTIRQKYNDDYVFIGVFDWWRNWLLQHSGNYVGYFLHELFGCVWCMSIWIAPVVVLLSLNEYTMYINYVFALSAGAIIVERYIAN